LYKACIPSIIRPTPRKTKALTRVVERARSKKIRRIMQKANPISAVYLKYRSFNTMLMTNMEKHSKTKRSVSRDFEKVQ
jgi:hypothetical protein